MKAQPAARGVAAIARAGARDVVAAGIHDDAEPALLLAESPWLPLLAPLWALDAMDADAITESAAVLAIFVAMFTSPPVEV